ARLFRLKDLMLIGVSSVRIRANSFYDAWMLRARKASPGRKFLWIANLSTRFPRFDECILHHVFGFVAVLQRTKRNGKKWTTHFSFWSRLALQPENRCKLSNRPDARVQPAAFRTSYRELFHGTATLRHR